MSHRDGVVNEVLFSCSGEGEEKGESGCCEGLRNCDGICDRCCDVHCASNEYITKDSDGCDYCAECPDTSSGLKCPILNGTDANGCSIYREKSVNDCPYPDTQELEGCDCVCKNGADSNGKCCSADEHEDNGLCCPFSQKNHEGQCSCENPKNNCGPSCCNGTGEVCRDAEKGICCAQELCGGICCPTNSVCENGVCVNPCEEGEVLVDYYDESGVKKQTCCPSGTIGADWSGSCCPAGLVGAFGHNHNWQYISRCCPMEGQENKGMIGLVGLAETYSCAPPDTTMDASAKVGSSTGHTWYVPFGVKNVQSGGWACAPETKRGGELHASCGEGLLCKHGWTVGKDCSYCFGEVVNNKCILPDCTKPRQHVGYCYCNPDNGSVLEYNYYTGGTHYSWYHNDVCVTPQEGGSNRCTKNLTFYNKTYGCMDCKTYLSTTYAPTTKENCLNCSQSAWDGKKCMACPKGTKPNSTRTACE